MSFLTDAIGGVKTANQPSSGSGGFLLNAITGNKPAAAPVISDNTPDSVPTPQPISPAGPKPAISVGGFSDVSEHVVPTPSGPTTIQASTDPASGNTELSSKEDHGNSYLDSLSKGESSLLGSLTSLQKTMNTPQGEPIDASVSIKLPFVDKSIVIPMKERTPLTAAAAEFAGGTVKFFAELPERLTDDVRDTWKTITGQGVPLQDLKKNDVDSYIDAANQMYKSLTDSGMSPTQAEIISTIYGVSTGLMDLTVIGGALDSGTKALASYAPVSDASVKTSMDVLGNPTTIDEAEQSYKNIARISHPDKPGGSTEVMSKANQSIAIIRKYFSDQNTFLAKLGIQAQKFRNIFTPSMEPSPEEQSTYLENYGLLPSPDMQTPEAMRTSVMPTEEPSVTAPEPLTPEERQVAVADHPEITISDNAVKTSLPITEFSGLTPAEGSPAGEVAALNDVNPKDVEVAKKAIQAGETPAVVVNTAPDGTIQVEDGNHRLAAYKELGVTDIPVIDNSGGKITAKQGVQTQDEFFRLAKGKESTSPTAKNKAYQSMPDREGYTKVYKPYGEQGKGFYYSPIQQATPSPVQGPSLSNISELNTQGGFINPGEVTKQFNEVFDKMRQNIADKKEAERLRSIFTGMRDVQITETNQLALQLKKMLPDTKDQEALLIYREFKGNIGELDKLLDGTSSIYDDYARYFKDENPEATDSNVAKAKEDAISRVKKYEGTITRASSPTEAMKTADNSLTEFFSKRLEEGREIGFLDSGMESKDYINHVLLKDKAPDIGKPKTTAGGGRMSRKFVFAKERTFDNILDAVAFGKKPATINAISSMQIYGERFGTTAATNILIPAIKDMGMAKWGTYGSENIPADWVPISPGSNALFRNSIPLVDKETGEVKVMSQQLFVPEKIQQALSPILDPDYLKMHLKGYDVTRFYQAYLKGVELSLSLFHAKSLTLTAINNMGYVNAMKMFSEDMASEEFLSAEREGAKYGLTTSIQGKTIEAYKGMSDIGTPITRRQMIAKLPIFKQIDQLTRNITKMTFDIMQRKFKVVDFIQKQNAWMANNVGVSQTKAESAFREIAKEVNSAYGGLHWENLGINRTTQGAMRLAFLAPDWTFSNWFTTKQAFQGGPAGTAARAFWARTIATGVILTELTSLFISGNLSKDPTSVFLGKDKTGKNIYANLFFAGASNDIINFLKNSQDYGLIEGAFMTTANKMGPLPRFGIQLATNRSYNGAQVVPKGSGPIVGTARSAFLAAQDLTPIPFSLSNPAAMFLNPAGNYTLPEYIVSALTGTRTRHVVPSGMTAITSGRKKGQLKVAKPKQQNPIIKQILTGQINKPKK